MSYRLASYKRIIICCDGTWMASNVGDGSTPSNIGKLARAVAPSGIDRDGEVVKQIVSYHNGLGSTSLPAAKAIEGGLGWGLDNEITQVYEFISNNYEAGDELFFFGFSRGAFTVRSTAGLISDIGILSAVDMEHFSGMWEAYRARDSKSPFEASKWYRDHKEKLNLSIPSIKVVGVFDTVGALGVPQWPGVKALQTMGIPLNQKYAFHDTALPGNVEYAFQSLALDEKRITFPPTLWHKTSDKQHLEQCWFPGVHANIGGQAELMLQDSDRGEIAANTLAWMIDSISDMLTFESTSLDLLVSQHATALLQNGVPSGWGCGKIVDNFSGLQGTFFRLLGQQTRTPGAYAKIGLGDTNELVHPMARYRQHRMPGWSPAAGEGWALKWLGNGANDVERRWAWTKDGHRSVPEYVMREGGILTIAIAGDKGRWNFSTRQGLSRTLCPEDVFTWLERKQSHVD